MITDVFTSGLAPGATFLYPLITYNGVLLPATPVPLIGVDMTSEVAICGVVFCAITAPVDVGLTIGATPLFSCRVEVGAPIIVPSVSRISAWTVLSAGLLLTSVGAGSIHAHVAAVKRLIDQ